MKVSLYTDGGARGNPGPAGIGAVLKDESGAVVETISQFIGVATNNVAEYRSLIAGLEAATALGMESCRVYMDSQLVVRQMKGEYRVKNPELKKLWQKARNLAEHIPQFDLVHVRREFNGEADSLVNQAIDEAL